MTVITWERSGTTEEGVCPFNARRHLHDVAGLIGDVFADELDANGQGALHEMKMVSRFSPLLGGLLSGAFFNDFVLGYVWMQDGRVIGNVTFQRADMAGSRYRISNVAVAAAHRRRGIAHDLMLATLRDIAARGASWAVLQVRVDNPGARRLYESLQFNDVCQDGVWEWHGLRHELREPSATLPPGVELAPFSPGWWREWIELIRAGRPALAEWAEPLDLDRYRPNLGRIIGETLGGLTGIRRVTRWGAWQDGVLMGVVEAATASGNGLHRLRFDVRPDLRGQLESVLLARGLRDLAAAPPYPVVVEHSGDDKAGVAALEAFKFRPQRVLLTMRRLMTPADEEL